jgi:4-carboxymuconolactone decarboxylase
MSLLRTIHVVSAVTVVAMLVGAASWHVSAQGGSGDTTVSIDPKTSSRFPPVRRDDLDTAGKKVYDDHVAEGINLGGPGPVSLRMWDPPVAEHGHAMNQYVRTKAGLSPAVVELVILTTTRELNAEYEYSGHEPAGLKAGLSQQVIDAVKFRRPLTGLPERDAAIIQLTREAVGQRKVSPATFARAEKLFGKKALVTMGAIMGEYNSAAILLAIAGQQMPAGRKSLLPVETR